jgi:hypothetical protein
MRRTPKIAAAAAGLVLAGGAVAAAVDAPPPAADAGLDVAEEQTGKDLPVRPEGQPEDDAVLETADTPDAAEHGVTVSETAHATESGPGKGAIVAAVASDGRSGGEAAPVDAPNDGGIDTAGEASDGASGTGEDHAADEAGAGSANAGDQAP